MVEAHVDSTQGRFAALFEQLDRELEEAVTTYDDALTKCYHLKAFGDRGGPGRGAVPDDLLQRRES